MSTMTFGNRISTTNLQELNKSNFEIFCSTIELLPEIDTEQTTKGPGKIWMNSSGSLCFEFFFHWTTNYSVSHGSAMDGKIIYPQRLVATEISGSKWYSDTAYEDIGPQTEHSHIERFSVIRGKLHDVYQEYDAARESSESYWLALNFRLNSHQLVLPFNDITTNSTEQGRDSKPKITSSARNILSFLIGDCHLACSQDIAGHYLSVQLTSNKLPPKDLEQILTDTLRFVTGSYLQCYLKRQRIDSKIRQTITSYQREKGMTETIPPISIEIGKDNNFIKLFKAYWHTHHDNETFKDIPGWVKSILFAENALLETQVLVLCIALEGITKLIEIPVPSTRSTNETLFLTQAIDKIEQLGNELSQDLAGDSQDQKDISNLTRIISGKISELSKHSSRDKVRYLKSIGVISKKQEKTWSKYRPKSAHGHKLDESPDELIGIKYSLLTAFYRIVFYLVRFSGEFRDYEQAEWADILFQPQEPLK